MCCCSSCGASRLVFVGVADSEFSPAVRRLVLARCAGACERCGKRVRLELHHRLYRSRGGSGDAGNAIALCGFGNADGCHGVAHSGRGEIEGFSVASSGDPFAVPVRLYRFGLALLDREGRVLRALGQACWSHSGFGAVAGCGACAPSGGVLWSFEEEKGWWG